MTSTFGDPAVVGNPARTGAAWPSVRASATGDSPPAQPPSGSAHIPTRSLSASTPGRPM